MRKPHQDILVKLLSEVDSTCQKHGIPYVCVDRLAWQAYKFHEFRDSTFDAYIAVPAEHIDSLKKELAAFENRAFEEYRHNKAKFLRYIDKGSFYFNLKDRRSLAKPGVAVDIRALDFSGRKSCSYQFGKKALSFPRSVFFPTKQFEFEGLSLAIPGNFDAFFSGIVGDNWRDTTYKGTIRKDSLETICDATLPYEEALELPQVKRALSLRRFKFRPIFNNIQSKRGPVEKKAGRYRKARVLTARRFYHWEQLFPRKLEIANLASSGDAEALEGVLSDYLKDVYEFAKKWDMGLYVDKAVFDAAKPILIERHGASFFEKYEKAIPVEHRKDIEAYLKDSGVKHPLLESGE